jgi:hypothetical protein
MKKQKHWVIQLIGFLIGWGLTIALICKIFC